MAGIQQPSSATISSSASMHVLSSSRWTDSQLFFSWIILRYQILCTCFGFSSLADLESVRHSLHPSHTPSDPPHSCHFDVSYSFCWVIILFHSVFISTTCTFTTMWTTPTLTWTSGWSFQIFSNGVRWFQSSMIVPSMAAYGSLMVAICTVANVGSCEKHFVILFHQGCFTIESNESRQ